MHLTLFFTRGNSLTKWHSIGSLEREIALYKGLHARGIQVSFVTYGTVEEENFAANLPGIEILYNRWNLPLPIYEIFCPWLHSKSLQRTDVVKTNQIKGAHTALLAGMVWHKPVIVRQGYIWSKNLSHRKNNTKKAKLAIVYENLVLRKAFRIIVTTQSMQQEMQQRYPELVGRITIIPNYVDTELFYPYSDHKNLRQVIFVGRLSDEKNLSSLIEAVFPLDVTLKIIGSGPLESMLKDQVLKSGGQVSFFGSCPNEKIPLELNEASIFVLPSYYEGHPKALIEAMSCGLAVLGTDVDGIRDLIQHGETGWLCQPDPASLRAAIEYLLANPNLCQELGQRARTFILDNYSLDKIINQEIELYTSI